LGEAQAQAQAKVMRKVPQPTAAQVDMSKGFIVVFSVVVRLFEMRGVTIILGISMESLK
jgi:hypothetical protein